MAECQASFAAALAMVHSSDLDPIGVGARLLFSRLLKPLLNAVANRFLGTTEIDAVQGLVGPLRIVLLGILVFIGSGYAYTLLRRHFWNDVGYVLIIFAATLLSMSVVGVSCNLYLRK